MKKPKDYYGPEVLQKVRQKWKKGAWYSLCRDCFKRYKKQGGYTYGADTKCSLCRKKGYVEFFPHITHDTLSLKK